MYNDGFKYWLAYKKNNTSYFRCSRYKSQCPGRCMMEDGKIRNTTEHNHPPEPDRALVDKFRKILTQRAAKEKTGLHTIYWEEATQRHADAAMLYSFSCAESAMRKARRKQLPSIPNTIKEFGDILKVSDLFRIHSGNNKEPFYQTTIVLEDATCVVFMHKKTLELIGRVEEMHVDASLDCQPQTPPNYHLLTVHAVQGYQSVPILYGIMTTKTQSAFASIFAYLREQLSIYIMPNIIMSDFDQAMHTALAYTFPEATVKGCWFHYTEAVIKQMKYLGLQRETIKGHGACALRMLLVLPFLPADYMAPGLEALKKWMQDKKIFSTGLTSLCSYVEHGWLRGVGAEKMSMFGITHCVNNHIQAFNKDLNNIVGIQNPMIWHMLESLTHIATKTFVKQSRKSKGINVTPKQLKKRQMVTETIINNATEQWIRTPVHLRAPLQFLQLSSHCISDNFYSGIINSVSKTSSLTSEANGGHKLKTKACLQSQLKQQQQINNANQNFDNIFNTHFNCQTSSHEIQTTSNYPRQIVYSLASCGEQSQQHQLQQQSNPTRISSKDPPPLAFFPKVYVQKVAQKRPQPISLEPPPLVPIRKKLKKDKI